MSRSSRRGGRAGSAKKAKHSAHALEDLRVRQGDDVPDARLPSVAIVILNYNGLHHLDRCFESLAALDYPKERFQVLLIDNGSSDGSVEEVRRKHAWVRLETNPTNRGFSGACNQGGALATEAEVLVFLNNDIRVEPPFLRELVAPIVRGECQAATAKMLSWDGKLMNSAGGGMNFHGIGIQHAYLHEPAPEHDVPRKTLFPCGGAMAMDAELFRSIGGFDEEFFAYYEDVDLGWRTWVLGHEVHYAPKAVCYHHHSSTSSTFPPETIRLLQVRNPLFSCVKNYEEENLQRILPAALALTVRRSLLVSGLDHRRFRIQEYQAGGPRPGPLAGLWARWRARAGDQVPIRAVSAADLIGVNDLLGRWDHWMERRREVQSRRKRSDEEIFRLFLKPMWCVEPEPAFQELHRGLSSLFHLDKLFRGLTIEGPDPK